MLRELTTGWSVLCHPQHLPGHPGWQRPSSSSGLLQVLRFLPMPSPTEFIHFQTPEGSGSFHLSPHTHPAGQTGTGLQCPPLPVSLARPALLSPNPNSTHGPAEASASLPTPTTWNKPQGEPPPCSHVALPSPQSCPLNWQLLEAVFHSSRYFQCLDRGGAQ